MEGIVFFFKIDNLDIKEDWYFGAPEDFFPDRELLDISGRESLKMFVEKQGGRISETELVKYGLSPAKLDLLAKSDVSIKEKKRGRKKKGRSSKLLMKTSLVCYYFIFMLILCMEL